MPAFNKLSFGLLLITLIAIGCGKEDSAGDIAAPPPQTAAKPATDLAAPAPPPGAAPDSLVASSVPTNQEEWKPGDGEPAPGKFPPAIKRNLGEDGKPDLEALTLTMREWSYFTDRFPKDMNELVTTKYLAKIPSPPAGKQYVVQSGSASVGLADIK